MNGVRYFLIIILLLLLLFNGTIEILAIKQGFSTEKLSEYDAKTFVDNINIIKFTKEPSKRTIECFDVNENGVIALGHSNIDDKTICIYTNDGTFQYGYNFKSSGSFGIELHKDYLTIYFVRSDVALTINSSCEVLSVDKIKTSSENTSYWNNSVFSTKRIVGNSEYTLRNDMGVFNIFASSYSQLIAINTINCEENIIYDVNQTHFIEIILLFVSAFLFVCFCVGYLILYVRKFKYIKR